MFFQRPTSSRFARFGQDPDEEERRHQATLDAQRAAEQRRQQEATDAIRRGQLINRNLQLPVTRLPRTEVERAGIPPTSTATPRPTEPAQPGAPPAGSDPELTRTTAPMAAVPWTTTVGELVILTSPAWLSFLFFRPTR